MTIDSLDQIVIFTSTSEFELQKKVNDFLKTDVHVTSIQYSTATKSDSNIRTLVEIVHSVMIHYWIEK